MIKSIIIGLFCILINSVIKGQTAGLEIEELFVFPGKDGKNFERNNFTEEGPTPVDLTLSGEKVFVAAIGKLTDISPNTTISISWNVQVNDEEIQPQEDITRTVDSGESFFINSALNEENGGTFINAGGKGSNFIKVNIIDIVNVDSNTNLNLQGSIETRVWSISNFEAILPLITLILLALLSRNVYIAMFFGIWLGSLIIEEGSITDSFKALFDDHMIPSITEDDNFRTITFTSFLSGFIAMIKRAGGQDGFSNAIGRYATTAKTTQLAAVMCGVGLFFDDYSSVLILGSSFKKLTDKFHVSREKLAFVADATSAPIASIAPISSWIAFELSRIAPELEEIKASSSFDTAQDLESEYPFFLSTIRSRYYPFFMLVIQVILIALGIEFGPMLYAERKTRLEKRTDGGDGRMEIPIEQDYTHPADDTPRKAYNFFIPIGFFISMLLTSLINIGKENIDIENELLSEQGRPLIGNSARDIFGATNSFEALVYTTMGGSLFALIFFLLQFKQNGKIVIPDRSSFLNTFDCRLKNSEDVALQEGIEINQDKDINVIRPLMFFTEGVNIWVEGFKNLVPAILILCMAFTIKSIVTGLGTDRLFTDIILNSDIAPEALPTIIFIVSGLLALATGTSFGTMSIMFPLVSFATFEKSGGDIQVFTVALSSIMAGAVFGDHSSLISDTTILASIGSGCQIGAHVYTQMPYAVWAALFAVLFGTLPAGYGADATAMLIFGMIFIAVATILVSAPIVSATGRLDFFSEMILKYTKSESLNKVKEETKKFAAENPELVDTEPMEVFKKIMPCIIPAQAWIRQKVPYFREDDTEDNVEDPGAGVSDHYVQNNGSNKKKSKPPSSVHNPMKEDEV